MDPNPKKFPILSFVMTKIGQISTLGSPSSSEIEVEEPSDLALEEGTLLKQMPHLKDPNLISSMGEAISDVAKTRSILKDLGPRPDHESLDFARVRIAEIESRVEMDGSDSPDLLKEILPYKAVLQVEEMHAAYEEQLRAAEERLERMYGSSAPAPEVRPTAEDDMVDEEVVAVLREVGLGKEVERVNLSERELRIIPEAMGRIHSLKTMNLSNNQLEAIPDSIAGLQNLVELNASTNLLVSLPDSIGLLLNLRILNVSKNKLKALPDSISCCRSLVEFDASFNDLTYLPTNIGHELVKLQKLSVQLNKLRSLPSSICEMKSLRYLDAHFNALHGLPHEIGRLLNLEVLNVGSNFSDLTEIPDSVGDLHNLRELDLSNNQIHVLPYTIRRLDKLRKLNLDQNPLVVPPLEVAEKGTEAVKDYMARKWLVLLAEEERARVVEAEHQFQTGWLARSKSWLKNWVGNVSERVSRTTAKSEEDSYLNQQL